MPAAAGVDARVNVMVGDATRFLHKVAGPFDVIFQDGDKPGYLHDARCLVALLRPGGVLARDNVLWSGAVVPGMAPTEADAGRHRGASRLQRPAVAGPEVPHRLAADRGRGLDFDEGVTLMSERREEFFETFNVALVVGGSITIPHLRRAVATLTTWSSS